MTSPGDSLKSNSVETSIEIASILLEAVPYAGGVLSSTATFFLEKRKNERLNKFLLKLAEELKQIKDKVNSDFVRSDEFRDLTEDIFSKAAETRQQEKLDALRAVFINTVLSDNPKYDEVEEITNLIANWQSRHLVLLKILVDPVAASAQRAGILGKDNELPPHILDKLKILLPDWEEDQLSRTIRDIVNEGLYQMPGGEKSWITLFGEKIVRFITNPL